MGGDASAKAPRYHFIHSGSIALCAGANQAFGALRILCVAGQKELLNSDR